MSRQLVLLAPVLFEFGGGFQFDRAGFDDLQFRTASRAVDDFSDFDVVVQRHVGTAFGASCHSDQYVGSSHYQTVEIPPANRFLCGDSDCSTMALPIDPVLIAVGLVLATAGIFIYRKALYGFGGLLGGAGGLLLGTNLAGG